MAVRKARNALFRTSGLVFFREVIGMFWQGNRFCSNYFRFCPGGRRVLALGFRAKRKPYTAITRGLRCFPGIILLSVIFNVMTDGGEGVVKRLFSGIPVNEIILVSLLRPIKDAKALQEARKQSF